jgi:hypothetical protein
MKHDLDTHHVKQLPGWACLSIGVGFVAAVCLGLVAVVVFAS